MAKAAGKNSRLAGEPYRMAPREAEPLVSTAITLAQSQLDWLGQESKRRTLALGQTVSKSEIMRELIEKEKAHG